MAGTGVSWQFGLKLRKAYGHGGIAVTHSLNALDLNDPTNFQIKVSGAELQSSIATLSSALADVTDGLANKQPLLSETAQLPASHVAGLVQSLTRLDSGILQRHPCRLHWT